MSVISQDTVSRILCFLIWKMMRIEPHPITHIIKQRVLVYVECNSDNEFKAYKCLGKTLERC